MRRLPQILSLSLSASLAVVVACSPTPPSQTPIPQSPPTASTPPAYLMPPRATLTRTPRPSTSTPLHGTRPTPWGQDYHPRESPTPSPTIGPPVSPSIPQGYTLFDSAWFTAPGGQTYSAFLLRTQALAPDTFPVRDSFLATFYVTRALESRQLASMPIPNYRRSLTEHSDFEAAAFVNWDNPFTQPGAWLLFTPMFPEEERAALRAHGVQSDINHNGWPEFAVAVQYCPISCTHPKPGYHFFEIASGDVVVPITADLPGTLGPCGLVHSIDPLTFSLEQAVPYEPIYNEIQLCWVYRWRDGAFVDVSFQYAREFISEAERITSEAVTDFGTPFNRPITELHNILLLYEQVSRREDGLRVFLELTDLANWPGTPPDYLCWLQLARATALADFAAGEPFSLPPTPWGFAWAGTPHFTDRILELDRAEYDLSACFPLLP